MRARSFAPLLLAAVFLRAADPISLPNGFRITPLATPHAVVLQLNPRLSDRPDVTVSQPVTTLMSPDGSRMLLLTSGYNKERGKRASDWPEYVFVYDTSVFPPKQLQALPVQNSFCGLAWNPSGNEFYASGGVDDRVYVFTKESGGNFARTAVIGLGHKSGNGLPSTMADSHLQAPKPMAGGLAVDPDGRRLLVANFYNDSVSFVDLKSRTMVHELDLRPGVADRTKAGQPGGEYPYWIAVRGSDTAFVSSPRDREIVVLNTGGTPSVKARIPIQGQPNRLILNRAQNRLFVAVDNSDSVAVVDAEWNQVMTSYSVVAPKTTLPGSNLPRGANPNSLALSPDERTLYVSNGGTNSIAVVDLTKGEVKGLIPTGWYPNSVSLSADGRYFYVANSKSVPGPNAGNCRGDARAPNIPDCARQPSSYVYNLEKGSLIAAPIPNETELAALTQRVAENNRFDQVRNRSNALAELRSRIHHVIYIVKENRTYDQVLGDLEVGDGDPSLTEFPEPLTPNHHALARNFVTLDNFLDSGEVSGVGWNWSVAARTTDFTEKTVPVQYAGRGLEYDWEGTNRNINVGIATLAERIKAQPLLGLGKPDENLLPGTADVAAPDSAQGGSGSGYIWDEVLRAGLTLRNYGFFCDLGRYENPKGNPGYMPISKTPFMDKIQQSVPTNPRLLQNSDLYFRSFDQNAADFYNFKEWEREFDQYAANGNLPNLTLLRLAHDHFGDFATAQFGINTPALQISDNDYAIGLVIEKLSKSRYASDTLVFIVEDDAQDGPDHVDAHRSIAFVAGPYVKQHAVVSERYTTVSMFRTMEAILGLEPSSLYAAAAAPMTEIFDLNQSAWSFNAKVPDLLRTSQLPLPPPTAENSLPRTPAVLAWMHDKHDARYWQKRIGDMDYDVEDRLDTGRFNRELWKGMMGSKPYPKVRSGEDLRENRAALLPKQAGSN